MSATLHTKSAGDAPDDTAKLLRASVEMERLRKALRDLEQAEANYRLVYQIASSVAHLDVGRAWDRMRRAGDEARAALAKAQGGEA